MLGIIVVPSLLVGQWLCSYLPVCQPLPSLAVQSREWSQQPCVALGVCQLLNSLDPALPCGNGTFIELSSTALRESAHCVLPGPWLILMKTWSF